MIALALLVLGGIFHNGRNEMAKDQPFPTNRGLGVSLLEWLKHNFVFQWFNILECSRPVAKWMPQLENK